MSETIVIAIIIAVAPTIVALGGVIIGLRNGRKVEQVHVLVNSNLDKVKKDLQTALDRVDKLEKYIQDKEKN
jgi:hypothetical protein